MKLRNRIFSSSHAPGYNTDGTPNERYIAYHEEKAKGGIGLTMIGGSSNVSPDSPSLWGQLNFGSDAIIEPMIQMTERIHEHDTAVMCQITHMGRRNVSNDGDWLPTISPSSVREPMHRFWPKQMELFDIRRVVSDFADAAKRARSGGLDGIELCATSHLLDQFWTPLVNRRTDEYGGSIENRLRFTFEVLESIREAIGTDIAVGIRMIGAEEQIGGLSTEESVEIAQRLANSGLLDFINITSSSLATEEGLSKAIPPSGTPLMPYVSLAASIKENVEIPVLHATRITDLESARHAISTGLIDLAGMTRAHFADPHIVKKLERGEEDRIRVCVGASLCINRLHQGLESVCIQNPATGRESIIPQLITSKADLKKKVVVVGAGPAGLEASRVLGERGHSVVLFEAQSSVGGQVNLAIRASRSQAELAGIVGWLKEETIRAGVDIRLNTMVHETDVESEKPDVVVIATGGLPDASFLSSGEDLIYTTWDVLSGYETPTGKVLIYDDNGGENAPSVAEFLSGRGVTDIELVTPDRQVMQDLSATLGPAYLRMLYRNGVKMTPDHRLISVENSGSAMRALMLNVHTRIETIRTVDSVIVENGVLPNDALYVDLREMSSNGGSVDIAAFTTGKAQPESKDRYELYRIGDAVASRGIAAAIYEARRLCMHI
jgi:2,4-dienoyl-CoA reductase-like NADH-dependent reductase (Old Yellow Enzyme family)